MESFKSLLPADHFHQGVLGLISLHDPLSFWSKLNLNKDWLLKNEQDQFYFEYQKAPAGNGRSQKFNLELLTQFLFGTPGPVPLFHFTHPEAQQSFRQLTNKLPLSFFIWGLDSV